MSFDIPFIERNRKTLFDEQLVSSREPIVQVMSRNGLRDDVLPVFQGTGAGVSVTDYKYTATSGTDAFGVASVNTVLKGSYKPGQALEAGGTFIFGTPTGACFQVFGFVTAEDIIGFARNGTDFGVVISTYNSTEIQTLTVTTGATAAETATVTINGIAYNINLTASSDTAITAAEIGEYFNQNPIPNYTVTANGDDVIALAAAPVPAGSFAFSSGTAVASWAQNRAGALPDYDGDFISASTFPDAPDWLSTLDVTKLNVGTIEIGYYGAKGIKFYIDNPATGEPEEVYFHEYLNANIDPIVLNPSLSVGWAVQNAGNTTSVSVQGASAGLFNHGKAILDESPQADDNEVTAAVSPTETNILSIRNRSVYGGTINAVDLFSIALTLANDSNKEALFVVRMNPDYDPAGPAPTWSYYDPVNSIAEICKDSVAIIGGSKVLSIQVSRLSATDFIDLSDKIGKLTARNTISFGVEPSAAGIMKAAINWKEDQ